MECPKGSACVDSTHEVKTINRAIDWYELVTESDLPIKVIQNKSGDGRVMIKVYNCKGTLIESRG